MIRKYIKVSIFLLVSFLIILLFLNTLYYFNIISIKVFNIIRFISSLILLFFAGFKMGRGATKNGYLEGVKIGFFIVLLFFSISLLFKEKVSVNLFIYYIILFMVPVVGSIKGINKKETK